MGQHPLKPVDEWLKHAEGIDDALRRHELDSIVAPTGGVAWLTDLVNGAHYTGSFSTPAAVAGYPPLSVPCGFAAGLPVGLSFVGSAWSDARILGVGFAFKQAPKALRFPSLVNSTHYLTKERKPSSTRSGASLMS